MIEKKFIKPADIAIILLALGLTVYSAVGVFAGAGGAARVVIQGPNNSQWIYPLDAEETVRVRGALGEDTVVRIHGGEVWAESSPCKNQLCVGMGRLNADSWRAFWIACLPNNVFFMIEGKDDHGRGHVDHTAW